MLADTHRVDIEAVDLLSVRSLHDGTEWVKPSDGPEEPAAGGDEPPAPEGTDDTPNPPESTPETQESTPEVSPAEPETIPAEPETIEAPVETVAEVEAVAVESDDPPSDIPLTEVGLTEKQLGLLDAAGIRTLAQLQAHTAEHGDLTDIDGIGEVTDQAIMEAVDAYRKAAA